MTTQKIVSGESRKQIYEASEKVLPWETKVPSSYQVAKISLISNRGHMVPNTSQPIQQPEKENLSYIKFRTKEKYANIQRKRKRDMKQNVN